MQTEGTPHSTMRLPVGYLRFTLVLSTYSNSGLARLLVLTDAV